MGGEIEGSDGTKASGLMEKELAQGMAGHTYQNLT
jgi:hypothetical protein